MEPVLRAAAVYVFLFLLFRLNGKRSLAEVTPFDFVLLLIISEATQPALTGEGYSVVNALVVIVTMVTLDIALTILASRYRRASRWINDVPLLIVENGKPIREHLKQERLSEEDVLVAARELQGVERMDQIRYAVLERNGRITIIPKEQSH